ncbi:hypothetical protein ES705_33645 [subsurface metagenome]
MKKIEWYRKELERLEKNLILLRDRVVPGQYYNNVDDMVEDVRRIKKKIIEEGGK